MKNVFFSIATVASIAAMLASCKPAEPTVTNGGGSSMQILCPYVEPTLDWSLSYKGLINTMMQRGFVSTRVTADRLYYDYSSRYELLETAVLSLDTAQCYRGAEITVKGNTISRSDIVKYLSQQYTETGSVSSPVKETFYRSKTKTDSILVSYRIENGYPVITYTKGMN